jgi:hypothetical protein
MLAELRRSCAQKKGVWNFQALKTPAFIEAGEFQTPFFGQSLTERDIGLGAAKIGCSQIA